jgi:hypothetical protein
MMIPLLRALWQLVGIVEGPFDDELLYAIQQLGASGTTEKSAISAIVEAAETVPLSSEKPR